MDLFENDLLGLPYIACQGGGLRAYVLRLGVLCSTFEVWGLGVVVVICRLRVALSWDSEFWV